MSAAFVRPPAHGSASGLVMALAMLVLPACSGGSSGTAGFGAPGPSGDTAASQPASLETQAACRQRVNEMFERRERAEIYAPASQMNTPFSANYTPDVPNRGLANQFFYEKTKSECERNAGTGAGSINAVTPVSAPPAANRR